MHVKTEAQLLIQYIPNHFGHVIALEVCELQNQAGWQGKMKSL